MEDKIIKWFPVILSLGAIVGGYYTLRAKVDEVTRTFANFLEEEYSNFKEKQEKYIQEHYDRLRALELKAERWEGSQGQINEQTKQQFEEIKIDLKEIKAILSKWHQN